MSVTRIVSVPYELPYAHLYLDDVEQICRILANALQTKSPDKPIMTTFLTRDLQMDSLEDLERHGGSITEFKINVRQSDYFSGLSVELRGFGSVPSIQLFTLDNESKWAAYGKIKAIFDARQLRIKNTITRLPGWLKLTAWALAVVFPWVLEVLHTRWWFDITYCGVLVALFFVMVRPSRVHFVRSRERSKSAIENRKSYIKSIILLCSGAVIEKLVEVAWQAARAWKK